MPSPTNIVMPCDGDAFAPHGWPIESMSCDLCQCYHQNVGKCLGPEGFVLLAHTAAEVARERQTGPSATGGTVTNVTLYPAGPDPRLVKDDWGWEE